MARVLVVDDEVGVVDLLTEIATSIGHEARSVTSVQKFREIYASFDPDVVILDLAMPEADGVELLRYLADAKSRARIVILSGFDSKVVESARRLGRAHGLDITAAVQKPMPIGDIKALLDRLATGG